MLSPFKKKLIMSYIKRNIERGYIDLADNQISEHIEDFSETECEELYGLLEAKMTEMEAKVNEVIEDEQPITADSDLSADTVNTLNTTAVD